MTLIEHSQADPGTLLYYFIIDILFKVVTLIKYMSSYLQVFCKTIVFKISQKKNYVGAFALKKQGTAA